MTARFSLFFGIIVCLSLPFRAQAQKEQDQDRLGPAAFYFSQYEHEPWREPGSPKALIHKSEQLFAEILVVGGFLYVRKKYIP